MNYLDLRLICFAAGSVIHAVQTVLVATRWKHTTGRLRAEVHQGLMIGVLTFFWQFGNFVLEAARALGSAPGALPYRAGEFTSVLALFLFPLMFTYLSRSRIAAFLRYPLVPWTALSVFSLVAAETGVSRPVLGLQLIAQVTLWLMLLFFIVFAIDAFHVPRAADGPDAAPPLTVSRVRAGRAYLTAAIVAAVLFLLILSGQKYANLAAMMTSVPFSIATAYGLQRFPFMDVFVREVLSGGIVLVLLAAAYAAVTSWFPPALQIFGMTMAAIVMIYAKTPLTRWVESRFMGHQESIESQEDRIGRTIRGIGNLELLPQQASGLLAKEFDAEWVSVGAEAKPGAAQVLSVPGSNPMCLALGPRVGGRSYMSRDLRLARTAALELATQFQHLSQLELREAATRAQMSALQAQINPHFLFNTLNVLAGFIHSDPEKAERLTEELADIFRYALESTRAALVKLGDELNFLEAYLEIEKARFEERLVFVIDVDVSMRHLLIPPMILQPIVENAIKHGIGPKVEGGEVRLTGRMEGDRLNLTVQDTGPGIARRPQPAGNGIGLSNVRERLRHMYGDAAVLEFEQSKSGGTRVSITLPQAVEVGL